MASVSDRPAEAIIPAPSAKTEQALIERCRLARKNRNLAVLEGLHALKHALRFEAGVEAAFTDDRAALIRLADSLAPDVAPLMEALVQQVPMPVFAALAPRTPETGVLALAKRPSIDASLLSASSREAPAIWLEEPAHLGNVGAVVRVAAAAGAGAVITSGRHDPWDPSAVRASAGLHFALPVMKLDTLPSNAGPLIAIDPEGEPLQEYALPADAILAFGSERQGLS
ncbi:MAG: TrmH family RNA methyltransferase, partial [Geminicoccaceae bacterium]